MEQEESSSHGDHPSDPEGETGQHGKALDGEHPTHEYVRLGGMLSKPGDVAYRYNFVTNRFDYVSPEITALLGFSEEEWLGMDVQGAIERLHPDDCLKVGDELHAVIGGGTTILEYRFLGKDGAYHRVQDRVEIITDADGRPRYRVGVLREHAASAEAGEGATVEVPAGKRGLVARWIERARLTTAKARVEVRGWRAAAVAAGVLLLLGGTYAYHAVRGVPASRGPAGESQATPGSATELAQRVESLTAERDRLQLRVRALERHLAAARDRSRTERRPAVAARAVRMTRPAAGQPPHKAAAKGMGRVLPLFGLPAHQPIAPAIAPDPPTSR